MVKRWALLCGGDSYAAGNVRLNKPTNLEGCVEDVNAIKQLLLQFNDPDLNIKMLTATARPITGEPEESADDWPTWKNIKRELQRIEDEANAEKNQHEHDRLLYFHYSGHGTTRARVSELPQEEHDADDDIQDLDGTALVMTDVALGGAYLTGRQLGFWIKRMVQKSGFRVTIVLDSCFSGHGLRNDDGGITSRTTHYTDNTMLEVDKMPEEDVDEDDNKNDAHRDAGEPRTSWLSNPRGCTVVTACSKQKPALEKIFPGARNKQGVLTYWLRDLLLGSINVPHLWPSYNRVVDYVRGKTKSSQTPMVFGDDLFEFFGLKSYTEGESCIAKRDRSGQITLDIGRTQGVVARDVYGVVPTISSTTEASPLILRIEVKSVEQFQSSAELLGQVDFNMWPAGEERHATLSQGALPHEVKIHLTPKDVVDRDLLKAELAGRIGLVLGDGARLENDFVISLDEDDNFQIRQNDILLPRIPTISTANSSWPADLIRVLSHVSRFQALQDLYDTSTGNSRLPHKDFKFVCDPEQVMDGEEVALSLNYTGPISSPLWVSVYCFSASWSITKVWPDSGTAAYETSFENDVPFELDIPMHFPSKCGKDDADQVKDHIYIFISTSCDGKIPSWGNICLKPLQPARLTGPMLWNNISTEDDSDQRIAGTANLKVPPKRPFSCLWTVLKNEVVTSARRV